MSTATQTQTQTQKTNGGTAHTAAKDEFVDYKIDVPTFKPELFSQRDEKNPKREIYKGLPVQGYVVGHELVNVKDPETGETKTQGLYTLQLTAPTKATNRDGETVDLKVGDALKLWANAQIKQALPPEVANHPGGVVEVRITPLYREPMPKSDKKMWTFDFKLKPEPIARKQIRGSGGAVIARLLATAPKQLSAGESHGAIDVEGEEIPF